MTTHYTHYTIRLTLEEVVVGAEGDDHNSGELWFEAGIVNDDGVDEKTVVHPKEIMQGWGSASSDTLARMIRDTRTEACLQISNLHQLGEQVDWVQFDGMIEEALAEFTEARRREPRTTQSVKLDLLYEMLEEAPPPEEMMWPHLGYFLSCNIVRACVTTTRWRKWSS